MIRDWENDFNTMVVTGLEVTRLRKKNRELRERIEELELELKAWISETDREVME